MTTRLEEAGCGADVNVKGLIPRWSLKPKDLWRGLEEKWTKRPRLEKTVKLIDKKTYEDYNQKKPSARDPNEVENTPLAQLPNSGVEGDNPKVEPQEK